MKAFRYVRPASVAAASELARGGATVKAGGSDLLDRMKERIATPDDVVALNETPADPTLHSIVKDGDVLRVGALVTLAEIAASKEIGALYPALAEASTQAASPQVRHRATLGGNLAQHTRCGYYRLASFPCWKRGDDACPVLADGAVQDEAGIFGNDSCASAHPASLPPVLGAIGARVVIAQGEKLEERPFDALWRAPEQGVEADVALAPGDIIAAVVLPKPATGRTVAYEDVRQKAAFDWALASCAVGVTIVAGKITEASIWLGSVAPTPHRAAAAEKALVGATLSDGAIQKAADAAVADATPLAGNRYKVDLVKVVVRRALLRAAGRDR